MPTPTEEQAQIANALNNLATAMEQMQVRYDAAQRANRRVRIALFFTTLIILGGVGYWAVTPIVTLTSTLAPRPLARLAPAAADAERQRLRELLSAEDLAQIEEFEMQIKWLNEYLKVSTDFDAGAAITLFLGQMSSSIKVMPPMYAEVRAMKQEMQSVNEQILSMNEKMNALPALAIEVQGLHWHVASMSADVDSSMGRAGRMLPWNR